MVENVSETLEAFKGFLTDLIGYKELLDDPAKERQDVETARADLNRQLGVMHEAMVELGVPRELGVAHHRLPIFETAFGIYDDETDGVVYTALTAAIDVTRQAVGRLEAMEAKEVRQRVCAREKNDPELRADIAEMNTATAEKLAAANAAAAKRQRFPLFLGGFVLGWMLAVYRWRIVGFFRYTFPDWRLPLKVLLVAVLALAVATIPNLIAAGGVDGMKKNFWSRLGLGLLFILLFIAVTYLSK